MERKCIICGCDISHLKANAIICGSVKCATERKKQKAKEFEQKEKGQE